MTLLLLDANSLAHRAFHSNGKSIGKFIGYVWDILTDTLPRLGIHPTHAAAIWDPSGPNWRHEIFHEYKIHRKPSDIGQHIKDCKQVCWHFGMLALSKDGYEADDLIATYTRMACPSQDVVIVSQDKDLMQLVRDNVWLLDHRTGRLIRNGDVHLRFGVNPDRLQDLLALVGDVADGVPGAAGIGYKGAAALLAEYGSMHQVLYNADRVIRRTHRRTLLDHGDVIKLAYRLIELRDCRPHIPANLGDLIWHGIDMGSLLKVLKQYGLRALAERLCHATGRDAA